VKVGDLVTVDVGKVFLGIVTELDPGWVCVYFLDGDTGYYDPNEVKCEVISEGR
jgi:hypothetical protein